MYVPEHFREARLEVLQGFVEQHPLATLVAMSSQGLTANHIPLQSQLAPAGGGWLRGHVARGNSLWREVQPDSAVLAIFTGADAYISPNWYPSKAEHGKVVPTWNYAAVHVRGRIRFIDDAAWLREFVTAFTQRHEAAHRAPWQVSDAPPDYIDGMLRAIIGFEIQVAEVVAKFKGSQNRSASDRGAVEEGLRAAGRAEREVTELVRP